MRQSTYTSAHLNRQRTCHAPYYPFPASDICFLPEHSRLLAHVRVCLSVRQGKKKENFLDRPIKLDYLPLHPELSVSQAAAKETERLAIGKRILADPCS